MVVLWLAITRGVGVQSEICGLVCTAAARLGVGRAPAILLKMNGLRLLWPFPAAQQPAYSAHLRTSHHQQRTIVVSDSIALTMYTCRQRDRGRAGHDPVVAGRDHDEPAQDQWDRATCRDHGVLSQVRVMF
jgi:hypothetical protein